MTVADPVIVIPSNRIWFNIDERLYAHIHDLDRTAWWVVPAAMGIPFYECRDGFTGVRSLDRPCDNCEEWFRSGDGTVHSLGKRDPACGGTARHTFQIEVDAPFLKVLAAPRGRCLLRASIAEGMVCRIIDESSLMDGTDPVVLLDPWGQAHLLDGGELPTCLAREGFRPDELTILQWATWWAGHHGYSIAIFPRTWDPVDPADLDLIPCRRIEWRYLDEVAP